MAYHSASLDDASPGQSNRSLQKKCDVLPQCPWQPAIRPYRLTWLRVPAESELPPEILELWQPSLEKLGFVPNVLRLYALRPSRLLAWNAHYEEAMKGESSLTKAERETIAVVVSVTNDCAYCIAAHSAALRKLTKDPALADQIAADYAGRTSPTG